jgi:hypothetical protein
LVAASARGQNCARRFPRILTAPARGIPEITDAGFR